MYVPPGPVSCFVSGFLSSMLTVHSWRFPSIVKNVKIWLAESSMCSAQPWLRMPLRPSRRSLSLK